MTPSSLPPPNQLGSRQLTQEGESLFSPAVLLRAIRKHWISVIVITALATTAAYVYTSKQPRIYEAVGTIQLDPQPLMPLGQAAVADSAYDYWSNLEYFATQHQVIASRKVAMMVVDRLGLATNAAFLNNLPSSPKPPDQKATREQAAEILRSRIKVEPISESRLTRVKYSDAEPERAQRILSTLVDSYVEQNLEGTLAATTQTGEWLDTQLIRLKRELESQEMDLHGYKTKNNLLSVSYGDQSNMLRAEIQQLNEKLTSIKAHRQAIVARLEALQAVNPEDPGEIPASELLNNGTLSQLRAGFLSAKQRLSSALAEGRGEMHPMVRVAQSERDLARAALTAELNNVRNGYALDLEAADKELAGVSRLYETAKRQALELNLKELEYHRLQRSKDNTEKLFGLVLERSTESGMSKMMPFNNVRVLDRPLKPGSPVSPKVTANLTVGVMLGLLLGIAAAIGRDLLDRTVRSAEEMERELGLPVLGALPDVARNGAMKSGYYGYGRSRRNRETEPPPSKEAASPELLVHTHPKSVVAEAARAIRTNIMFMSPDRPYRTLLVTSAGPADGKTTVAACIAIAIAQTGQSVCLVDCDLRKSRVHTLFKQRNDEGMTTALLDASSLDSVLRDTGVPNLSVLRAGPTPPNPADLMHSEAFGNVLSLLRQRFDRVIIDSPPVGPVTDGVIISTRVDATVLVVRALSTRREAARRAMRALRDVGANCAGFVLNAASAPAGQYYSAYYAAYAPSPNEGVSSST